MEVADILIVDDHPDIRHLLARIFTSAGLRSDTAANGEEALAKLRDRRFRCLLTDYDMPGIDGVELAKRAMEIYPDLRIMLSSGDLPAEAGRRALALGVADILDKPLSARKALARSGLLAEERPTAATIGGV